jgi:hypothetical protein
MGNIFALLREIMNQYLEEWEARRKEREKAQEKGEGQSKSLQPGYDPRSQDGED